MEKIINFLNTPFDYLKSWAGKILHVSTTIALCAFLIYGLNAFNLGGWLKLPQWISFLGPLGFILIGMGIMMILQIAIHFSFKNRVFKIKHLLIWLISEVAFISVVLALVYGDINYFLLEWLTTLKYTSFLIIIPYTLSLLIISSIFSVKPAPVEPAATFSSHLLNFTDEKDQVKLSVKSSNVLYLESTDNYVTIHYTDEQGTKKELVRNTLKRIETAMVDKGLMRCHRSYIINLSNIESIKKVNRNYQIKIKNIDPFIPVSKSFIPQIQEIMGRL